MAAKVGAAADLKHTGGTPVPLPGAKIRASCDNLWALKFPG